MPVNIKRWYMNNFDHWIEVTRGLYRYVISAKVCYEIDISYWNHSGDILNARASLYIVEEWMNDAGDFFFERECLLEKSTVSECIGYAIKDNKENNK